MASIETAVGVPLDEIDADVQDLDDRIEVLEANRAIGAFSAWREGTTLTPGASLLTLPEEFDVSGWYDPSTGRFTPKVAGIYRLDTFGTSLADGHDTTLAWSLSIRKNGNPVRIAQAGAPADRTVPPIDLVVAVIARVVANGTTDYFDLIADVGEPQLVAHLTFAGELVGKL